MKQMIDGKVHRRLSPTRYDPEYLFSIGLAMTKESPSKYGRYICKKVAVSKLYLTAMVAKNTQRPQSYDIDN